MRAHEFADQGAAGIVLYAEDTGRYGLQQRSNTVNDPGIWAAWGGGREPGETLEQCARRELAEEGGYTGPIQLSRLGENSQYVTFLGRVPHEFKPQRDDEWQDYCWVNPGDWPTPLHPGTAAALRNINVAEDKIGTLHFPKIIVDIDDHSIERAQTHGVDPNDIDTVLKKLETITDELLALEINNKVWVYDSALNVALGMRRTSSRLPRFLLKTVINARPYDGQTPVVDIR